MSRSRRQERAHTRLIGSATARRRATEEEHMRSSLRRVLPAVIAALALGAVGASSALADNYVALGDSYSSGTGTRDYSFDSTCQRGPYAYPALISVDRPNTTLTFKACSGAKTGDVL